MLWKTSSNTLNCLPSYNQLSASSVNNEWAEQNTLHGTIRLIRSRLIFAGEEADMKEELTIVN